MTRNELLRYISERPALATRINELEGENFTRLKTPVLEEYIHEYDKPTQKVPTSDAYRSAALAFLITLEQKGVLDDLLSEIK